MKRTLVAILGIATVVLAGCSSSPVQTSTDTKGIEEVKTPTSYYGVITFCSHGARVWETSNGGIAIQSSSATADC